MEIYALLRVHRLEAFVGPELGVDDHILDDCCCVHRDTNAAGLEGITSKETFVLWFLEMLYVYA